MTYIYWNPDALIGGIMLPLMPTGEPRGWADVGEARSTEEYDAILTVAQERLHDLVAAEDAMEIMDDDTIIGADRWSALCDEIVAEGRRRCESSRK